MPLEIPQLPAWMNDEFRDCLEQEMARCEGTRYRIYTDSKGNLTGGIGWNFTANGIPPWVVWGLLFQAVNVAVADLTAHIPWWRQLDPVRQRAMINLCINMGWPRLSGFVHMLAALRQQDFGEAAKQLVDSDWWNEVGRRGPFIRHMIETGTEPVGIAHVPLPA